MSNHLGGHAGITHLDHGALDWLIESFNVKTMVDIGCGPGGMVSLAKEKGIEVLGIDGDPTLKNKWFDKELFLLHDFTIGSPDINRTFDLAWSVEFVEHVEEKYMDAYLGVFKLAKNIVITFAPPGWPGHHHVNCQPEEYWIEKFSNYNLEYSEVYTKKLRETSTMNVGVKPAISRGKEWSRTFVKDRGLFFTNKDNK